MVRIIVKICQSTTCTRLGEVAQGGRERFIAAQNGFQFAVALANGVKGALHQGGDVGIVETEQIKAAIVEVAFGQGRIFLFETGGKLPEMRIGSLAQGQQLLFGERIVLINKVIHLRLELSFVDPFHD